MVSFTRQMLAVHRGAADVGRGALLDPGAGTIAASALMGLPCPQQVRIGGDG